MIILRSANRKLALGAILLASISLVGCGSTSLYLTESIYLTSPFPPEEQNDDRYMFIAPYFAKLKTRLNIAVSKDSKMSITTVAVPEARSYLYVLKNALFDDTIAVDVDADGLLTKSGTTSKQQLTSIITTLAQTAAQLTGGPRTAGVAGEEEDPCQKVFKSLAESSTLTEDISTTPQSYLIRKGQNGVSIWLDLNFNDLKPAEAVTSAPHEGIVVFYPYPAYATLVCKSADKAVLVKYAAAKINLYRDSHFIDPKRDFFTNEDHVATLEAGFFTGQTYKAQSSAKTVVDTITAPVRAVMPTVTVNTQVVSVPGSADKITTTTSRTSPKGGQ